MLHLRIEHGRPFFSISPRGKIGTRFGEGCKRKRERRMLSRVRFVAVAL
jgi:hypothetical protein